MQWYTLNFGTKQGLDITHFTTNIYCQLIIKEQVILLVEHLNNFHNIISVSAVSTKF